MILHLTSFFLVRFIFSHIIQFFVVISFVWMHFFLPRKYHLYGGKKRSKIQLVTIYAEAVLNADDWRISLQLERKNISITKLGLKINAEKKTNVQKQWAFFPRMKNEHAYVTMPEYTYARDKKMRFCMVKLISSSEAGKNLLRIVSKMLETSSTVIGAQQHQ